MSGYRLLDFYFADTDELLKCAWISDMCTVHEFIDCARALGYLRHDCRLSEVAVVHRAKVLGNDVLLSSVDVSPGERLLVLRSGRDVDSECVFALMSQGLSVPRAMALLRYTSNDLGEARDFVGSVWDPRSVRDMLLDEGSSLFKIVKLIGCQNRQSAEHFLGSLLLNPACFERELASLAFDCCAKSEYGGGPLFHTFSLLLRTYHHVMPNAMRDCRLCKGCMFSEHEMRRAENHHMTGKSVLQSLEFGQLEEVRHAAREFRIAVDAGFCPSLVLYSWCLEIFCDGRDDYEIRLCLNYVDHATCGLSDEYVQHLYRKLRKRHGKDTSRRLGSARNMREYHQKACIVRSWGLEHLKVKAILNKPVEIHEYLRSAANSGDSWAKQAIQHIQSLGYIPDHLIKEHLRESWARIVAYITGDGNEPHGTCYCIPDELVDSKGKTESQATLDLDTWRKESLTNDPLAMYVYGLCLFYGYGTEVNFVRGLRYVRLSADSGFSEGQHFLALCLSKGKVVEQDLAESARYFKMSADQGFAKAQYNYALCLSEGEGVRQDLAESARYFKMSADQGIAQAQYNYAMCLLNGDRVSVDVEEAWRYLKMSADQGNAQAQYILAVQSAY